VSPLLFMPRLCKRLFGQRCPRNWPCHVAELVLLLHAGKLIAAISSRTICYQACSSCLADGLAVHHDCYCPSPMACTASAGHGLLPL
jgi:hypothetical protein